MSDLRDADAKLLTSVGRATEAAGLARVRRDPADPFQAVMGIPSPVWENQAESKLTDGGCSIYGEVERCRMSATHRVWIGCTVGEHLDKSGVCEAHAVQLERGKSAYHCRRCWDAMGADSLARVIKVERIKDDVE